MGRNTSRSVAIGEEGRNTNSTLTAEELNTVSVWVTAVAAVFGGVIGMMGALLGARLQLKEARHVRSEQYDREDRFRLHKDRIDAYSTFYIAAGNARRLMMSHAPLDELREVRVAVWTAFTRILLIGDEQVLSAVNEILDYVTEVAHHNRKFELIEYAALIRRFQESARIDLLSRP